MKDGTNRAYTAKLARMRIPLLRFWNLCTTHTSRMLLPFRTKAARKVVHESGDCLLSLRMLGQLSLHMHCNMTCACAHYESWASPCTKSTPGSRRR